jgi:hypothetical protein
MRESFFSPKGCVLMAKDYAKYSIKRSYKRKNLGAFKIFLVLFFAAILVSGWLYFKKEPKSQNIQWKISKQKKRSEKIDKVVKVVTNTDAVTSTDTNDDEPQFEFYTILPK